MTGALRNLSITLIFLGVAFFALWKIILSPGIIGLRVDWILPPFGGQYKSYLEWGLYAWNPSPDFGQGGGSPGISLKVFLYFLSVLGLEGDVITKFICIFIITLAGCSMFYLCRKIGLTTPVSILSGIFYMSTPAMFEMILSGALNVQLDYALIPLALAFFTESLKEDKSIKKSLACGIVASIIATTGLFALVNILLIYYAFQILSKPHLENFLRGMKSLIIIGVVTFLSQSYWMAPFFVELGTGQLSRTIPAVLGNMPVRFLIVEASIVDTLRLRGSHLGYMFDVAGQWSVWQFVSFVPAILAFFTLLLKPKTKTTVLFATLTILGIGLVSASSIFGSSWISLINVFPFLLAYRDPYKLNEITNLGYAVLIGSTTELLLGFGGGWSNNLNYISLTVNRVGKTISCTLQKSKIRMISQTIVFVIVLSLLAMYSWPFFTGDFGGNIQTQNYDGKYKGLWERFSTDPDSYRVFMLPAPYPTIYNGSKFAGYDPMAYFLGKPTLYTGKYYDPQLQIFLINTLYGNRTQHLGQLLSFANVRYLVLDLNKSTTATDNYWTKSYFSESDFTNQKIIATLEQQKEIELQQINGSLMIFRNNNYLPGTFSSNEVVLFAGDLSLLVSTSYPEKLGISNAIIVFISQLSADELESLNPSNMTIVIQDGYQAELALTAASRNNYAFNLLGFASENAPDKGWTPFFWPWYNWYYQAQLERLVFTFVPANLTIPYTVTQGGDYDVYLKTYFGTRASKIKVYSDNAIAGEVATEAPTEMGFKWVRLNSLNLSQGNHDLVIESAAGENALASLVIIPKSVIETAYDKVNRLLQRSRVIIFSEAEWYHNRRSQEETPSFKVLWDDNLTSFWTIASGGTEGSLGNPLVYDDTTQVISGKNSLRLAVNGNGTYNYVAVDHVYDLPQDFSNYDYLTVWLYGQNSLSTLFIRLEDSQQRAQEWRPVEDWVGWKKLVLPLKHPDVGGILLSDIKKIRIQKLVPGTLYVDRGGLDSMDQAVTQIGVNASHGFALSTKVISFNQSINLPKSGIYRIYLRGVSNSAESNVTLGIGDYRSTVTMRSSGDFEQYNFSDVYLAKGIVNLTFSKSGNNLVLYDQVFLVELPKQDSVAENSVISVERINPARFRIQVHASRPFYLFHSETYKDSWKLYLPDGVEASHFVGYSFGNLYFVNKTGDFEMKLEHSEQNLLDLTLPLSFSAFAIAVILVAIPTQKFALPKRVNFLKDKKI